MLYILNNIKNKPLTNYFSQFVDSSESVHDVYIVYSRKRKALFDFFSNIYIYIDINIYIYRKIFLHTFPKTQTRCRGKIQLHKHGAGTTKHKHGAGKSHGAGKIYIQLHKHGAGTTNHKHGAGKSHGAGNFF